jgi:hypothetical protein
VRRRHRRTERTASSTLSDVAQTSGVTTAMDHHGLAVERNLRPARSEQGDHDDQGEQVDDHGDDEDDEGEESEDSGDH